ncbi:MAG: hypothetical protein U0234_07540 [Sandaracinus sp.]
MGKNKFVAIDEVASDHKIASVHVAGVPDRELADIMRGVADAAVARGVDLRAGEIADLAIALGNETFGFPSASRPGPADPFGWGAPSEPSLDGAPSRRSLVADELIDPWAGTGPGSGLLDPWASEHTRPTADPADGPPRNRSSVAQRTRGPGESGGTATSPIGTEADLDRAVEDWIAQHGSEDLSAHFGQEEDFFFPGDSDRAERDPAMLGESYGHFGHQWRATGRARETPDGWVPVPQNPHIGGDDSASAGSAALLARLIAGHPAIRRLYQTDRRTSVQREKGPGKNPGPERGTTAVHAGGMIGRIPGWYDPDPNAPLRARAPTRPFRREIGPGRDSWGGRSALHSRALRLALASWPR